MKEAPLPLGGRRDEEGRLIIGDPEKARCPFCGQHAITTSRDGRTIIYRPGLGCCAPRLIQELVWRVEEDERTVADIAEVNQALEDHQKEIELLRDLGDQRGVKALMAKTPHIRRGAEKQIEQLNYRRTGRPGDEDDRGTRGEISDILARLAGMDLSSTKVKEAQFQVLSLIGATPRVRARLERELKGIL